MQYWVLILFSFLIYSGVAGAHPHKLGKLGHGQSLENYQIKLDFIQENFTQDWRDSDITLAKKNSTGNSDESSKSKKSQRLDAKKQVKKYKDQQQKEH